MSAALTPWFPAGSKPAFSGVYETRSNGDRVSGYQHWNGQRWGYWGSNIEEADGGRFIPSSFNSPRWRGLAADPATDTPP